MYIKSISYLNLLSQMVYFIIIIILIRHDIPLENSYLAPELLLIGTCPSYEQDFNQILLQPEFHNKQRKYYLYRLRVPTTI